MDNSGRGKLKQSLHVGRLNWILTTALPLVPDFRLFLNGNEVQSSKESILKIKTWQVGKEDEAARKLNYVTGQVQRKEKPFDFYVEIPGCGKIFGEFELFQEPLDKGKSSESGRSHGFFILARKRLINLEDDIFGITSIP